MDKSIRQNVNNKTTMLTHTIEQINLIVSMKHFISEYTFFSSVYKLE